MAEIQLKDNPDWHASAQSLVNGCLSLESMEERVQLLEKLCHRLGDQLYPAFLQILGVIAANGDQKSQKLVTQTLTHGLATGRLPSGQLSAWGAQKSPSNSSFGQTRSLGPVEYLCAWYSQPSGRNPLSANEFKQGMLKLLQLISSDEPAKLTYCTKLHADLQDPIGGVLSSQTRAAMHQLVQAWESEQTLEKVIDSYINALQGDRLERLNSINNLFKP